MVKEHWKYRNCSGCGIRFHEDVLDENDFCPRCTIDEVNDYDKVMESQVEREWKLEQMRKDSMEG